MTLQSVNHPLSNRRSISNSLGSSKLAPGPQGWSKSEEKCHPDRCFGGNLVFHKYKISTKLTRFFLLSKKFYCPDFEYLLTSTPQKKKKKTGKDTSHIDGRGNSSLKASLKGWSLIHLDLVPDNGGFNPPSYGHFHRETHDKLEEMGCPIQLSRLAFGFSESMLVASCTQKVGSNMVKHSMDWLKPKISKPSGNHRFSW